MRMLLGTVLDAATYLPTYLPTRQEGWLYRSELRQSILPLPEPGQNVSVNMMFQKC